MVKMFGIYEINVAEQSIKSIREGFLRYFVGFARKYTCSEKEITEASIKGIQINMKNYEKWIEEDKREGLSLEIWNEFYEKAKTALGNLNEGHTVEYDNEIIHPL